MTPYEINSETLPVAIIAVMLIFALYVLYITYSKKDLTCCLKLLFGIESLVFLGIIITQVYFIPKFSSEIKEAFRNGSEIICKLKDKNNLVISSKRGYVLKSGFFIKNGVALGADRCMILQEK